MPIDKIHLYTIRINNPTPSSPHSDLPTQEYLNRGLATSISQGSRFIATIPTYDSQSFVTDYLQSWPTQPQSPRLPTPASATPTATPDLVSDFVLFPSSTPRSERGLATSYTDLSFAPGSAFTGQRQLQSHRRNSTQQFNSASPIPQRRVSNNIHGSSPATSSNGLHLGQHSRTRPPVPLFANNSPGTINQQLQTSNMSRNHSQGSSLASSPPISQLTHCSDNDLIDWSQADEPLFSAEENTMDSYYSPHVALSRNTSTNSMSPAGTVFPRDVLNTPSVQTSGALSALTTPDSNTLDSPEVAYFTGDSSAFFEELPAEAENWDSLFDGNPKPPPIPQALVQTHGNESPLVDGPESAPPMSRNASSPGKSSSRGSLQGRQSAKSGVSKRRVRNDLPAITVDDPNDNVALKRARNTMAARKSRQRRQTHIDQLEQQNDLLKKENAQLRARLEHEMSISLYKSHNE